MSSLIECEITENITIKDYQIIGTIEEFKTLKAKNTALEIEIQPWTDTKCPCGYVFSKHHGDGYHSVPYENQTNHCPNCGQKLKWDK